MYRNSFLHGENVSKLCLPEQLNDVVFVGLHKLWYPCIEKTVWFSKLRMYCPGLENDIKERIKKDESKAKHSSDHDPNFYLLPIQNY